MTIRHYRGFSALPRAISPQGVAIYFIAEPCGEMAIPGGFLGGGDTGGRAPHGGGGWGFAVACLVRLHTNCISMVMSFLLIDFFK